MHGELFEVHGTHQAFQARVHFGHEARGAGVDLDAVEFYLLAQPDRVGGIAGEAVDMFDQDDIEGPALGVLDHPQERHAAMHRGAGNGLVGVDLHHAPPLPAGVLAAKFDLVGDGSRIL
jgi:hypothetical protein